MGFLENWTILPFPRNGIRRFLWSIRLMPSSALPFEQKTKIAFEKPEFIHKACMEFMEAVFKIRFQISILYVLLRKIFITYIYLFWISLIILLTNFFDIAFSFL